MRWLLEQDRRKTGTFERRKMVVGDKWVYNTQDLVEGRVDLSRRPEFRRGSSMQFQVIYSAILVIPPTSTPSPLFYPCINSSSTPTYPKPQSLRDAANCRLLTHATEISRPYSIRTTGAPDHQTRLTQRRLSGATVLVVKSGRTCRTVSDRGEVA